MNKPSEDELLHALGRVQDLVGRAKGLVMNDRDPNRMDNLLSCLGEAFDLCVEASGNHPPADKLSVTVNMDDRLAPLFRENPIVAHALRLWHFGQISYEDALVMCVLNLAKVNEEQAAVLQQIAERMPNPINIHLTEDQREWFRKTLEESRGR